MAWSYSVESRWHSSVGSGPVDDSPNLSQEVRVRPRFVEGAQEAIARPRHSRIPVPAVDLLSKVRAPDESRAELPVLRSKSVAGSLLAAPVAAA